MAVASPRDGQLKHVTVTSLTRRLRLCRHYSHTAIVAAGVVRLIITTTVIETIIATPVLMMMTITIITMMIMTVVSQ